MMKGGLSELMKQAQKVQDHLQQAQAELANLEVTGESGAGLVKVVMAGNHDVKRVVIDSGLMQDGKEMIEDLVAAAFNDANRRVEELSKEKMAGMAAGFNLPGGFKLPF